MRTSLSWGTVVAAGLVVTALLTCGASAAAPLRAPESRCGANTLCPNDPAPTGPPDPGDQTTAEQRVIEGYVAKQKGCTPATPPDPESVIWDPPGFTPNVGGSGNVVDASPALGGHFRADWVNGRWHIEYMYC